MSSKKQLLKKLTSHLEYLAHNFLPVGSIEPLQKPSLPLNFKANYGQPHAREQASYATAHYFTFDPTKNPAIEKFPSFPTSEVDVQAESFSPNGAFRALVRKKSDKTTIEIWSKNMMVQSLRVSDLHGNLYTDAQFTLKPLTWSNNQKRILYIAEKKEDKAPKYYDDIKKDEDAEKIFKNYMFKHDLGEGYTGKFSPFLFVYDIENNQLSKVANVPEDVIPTYASFIDEDGTKIVFCGYHLGQSGQGLLFAYNRDTKIYLIEDLKLEPLNNKKPKEEGSSSSSTDGKENKGDLVKLTKDYISIFPIVSNNFERVAYFFSPKVNTHGTGLGLKVLSLSQARALNRQAEQLVLDIVRENKGEFCGVMSYHDRLCKTRWLTDNKHLIFNTDIRGAIGLYIVNVDTKELKRIDAPEFSTEEWRIKNVHGNTIFASISNVVGHSKFGVYHGLDLEAGKLDQVTKNAKWHFFDLGPEETLFGQTDKDETLSQLKNMGEVKEKRITIDGVESMFFYLEEVKDDKGVNIPIKDRPLMVALHGGPHGSATGMFSMLRQYSLYKGYNLLYPNFSGSTGYGQDFLERLPSKIGVIDTKEIKAVIDYCIENGLGNQEKLALMGGSYGGYLGAVLLAKYPTLFKCGILKNPVVNLPYTFEGSDIPEWAYCEVFNQDMNHEPTSEEFKTFYDFSPICMNKDIKSSILLMVGAKDRRVPVGGAVHYYKTLKGKGVDIEFAYYPEDQHGLSGSPETDTDQFVKTYAFLEEKLGSNGR